MNKQGIIDCIPPSFATSYQIDMIVDQLSKVQAELNELRRRIEALERKGEVGFFDE